MWGILAFIFRGLFVSNASFLFIQVCGQKGQYKHILDCLTFDLFGKKKNYTVH